MSASFQADAPLRISSPASRHSATLFHYSVLGGVLKSPIEFPELPAAAPVHPSWSLEVRETAAAVASAELLGERQLGEEVYRLHRTSAGFRLEYSHAGCFDISPDGARISWAPSPDASLELARSIILGPALAIALEIDGLLCLHGSAVGFATGAVGFLGPKYHGKSTLATALTAAGASLISDDLLAVASGSPPRVLPGVPIVRLWEDAAARLDIERLCNSVIGGVKRTATGFSGRALKAADAPLAAIYLLKPVSSTWGEACERVRLAGAAAAISLAHQTKLPPSLVGPRMAGQQLRCAAAIAAGVPIYELRIQRDFARLAAAVQAILEWHAPARPHVHQSA